MAKTPKRRTTAKTPKRRTAKPVSPGAEPARLRSELREAHEQQRATAEILRAIAGNPGDPDRVLATIAQTAHQLFGTHRSAITRIEGNIFRDVIASGEAAQEFRQQISGTPVDRSSVSGLSALEKRLVHIEDVPQFVHEISRASFDVARTVAAAPLLREGQVIGTISMTRREVRPFTDKQLQLLQSFADQAVIAIENARLLDELRESLETQTASADILRTIASSPAEAERALDKIAEITARLFGASSVNIRRADGDRLLFVGGAGPAVERVRSVVTDSQTLTPISLPGAAIAEKRQIHVPDIEHLDPRLAAWPGFEPARLAGTRTIVATPLMREGQAIGAMMVHRSEVKPFTDKELAQLANFADQAVIAIENARLLDELNAHMRDLSESLERQTASAEILRAIASTPGEVERVLDTIANTAYRLFDAFGTVITRIDGEAFRQAASAGDSAEVFRAWVTGLPIDRGSIHGRAVLEKHTIHIEDMQAARAQFPTRPSDRENLEIRTIAAVPLMREGEAIGTIAIARGVVQPFTDKELELAQSFADQAVIAIENARLLDELEGWNRNLEARVTEQVSEIERMGQLRRFLSPQIADLVSSGSAALLESHRREITVVYGDMRGFTAFAESSEPEEVMGVMGEYHAALGALIHEYEGTLERFVGDGVMVLFNDPVPCPDPAARAVKMAIAMRERFATLSKKWMTRGHELGFGVGIAQGYATLGRIGFEGRFDYGSIGTVSNLGARLCAEAQDGQILVSRQVQAAVDDIAHCEPIGELTLKGLRRPVATYNVVGLKG